MLICIAQSSSSQPAAFQIGLLNLLLTTELDDEQRLYVITGSNQCWRMHVRVPTGLVEGILADTNVTKSK